MTDGEDMNGLLDADYPAQFEAKLLRVFREAQLNLDTKRAALFSPVNVANGVFIFTVAASTIPYYLTAGVDLESNSSYLNAVVPKCTVMLNVVGGAYSAHEVWRYAQQVLQEDSPVKQRFLKALFSLAGSAYSSFPAIAGANTLGKDTKQKVFLMCTISVSNLVYNLFSSYRFIDRGLVPLSNHLQYVLLQEKYRWYSCMQLKAALKAHLEQAVSQLKQTPSRAREVFEMIEATDNGYAKLALLAEKRPERQSASAPWGRFFSSLLATAGGVAMASSWSGYACSVEQMLGDHMNEGWAWTLSSTIMAPLTFLAYSIGSKGIASVFYLLEQKINGEPVIWPLTLRSYPKTTLSLSLLMVFLAAFGWADSVVLLRKSCPELIQNLIGESCYANAAGFNALLTIEFIDQLIKKYIKKWGKDDEKISLKVIEAVEALMAVIENMPNPAFAKAVTAARAAPLQRFFRDSEECNGPFLRLSQEAVPLARSV